MKTYHALLNITPRTDGLFDTHITIEETTDKFIFGNLGETCANTANQLIALIEKITNRAQTYSNSIKIDSNFQQVLSRVELRIHTNHE
jgi:hypothetical protein